MLVKRRALLKAFAAAIMAPVAGNVLAQAPLSPTAEEQQVINYLATHGVTRFSLLNKQRGEILFIDDGQITSSDSALSGKIKGDSPRKEFGTTPAGIHILQPYGNGTHIGYKDVGDAIDYAIHTVISPPGERRLERLSGKNSEFKRISSGCVNVSQKVMDKLHKFIEISQQIFKNDDDDDKTPAIMGSFFVVLPEEAPIASILRPPELPHPR